MIPPPPPVLLEADPRSVLVGVAVGVVAALAILAIWRRD